MKKVININFQGRVIPIEEPAYEELRKYVDSLRQYFSNEEGRDEIINDIENRIAELFTVKLANEGAGCITESDLDSIIGSIGRPEDLEREETDNKQETPGKNQSSESNQPQQAEPKASFFRNSDDSILGGVCSGLAHYLKIDPTIVRLLFAIITFGGFGTGILLYIVLWIVLPPRALKLNVKRRLFRNPDDKMVGGVCAGLSSYFNIATWIPRLIFLSPILLGFLNQFFWGPVGLLAIPFGGMLFLAYIILWIVVPMASSASEKLEMRGEKVDLESIRETVREEIQGIKTRSAKLGEQVEKKAEAWGREASQTASHVASTMANSGRRSGIGRAIGMLFKIFFLFIASLLAFTLVMALVGLLFGTVVLFPLKDFILRDFWENATAGGTIILFLAVPIIALVIWLIRRITGTRSKNNYLGYAFGTLWALGWVSLFAFISLMVRHFEKRAETEEVVPINQPTTGSLELRLGRYPGRFERISWFEDENDGPALSPENDSLILNTVNIRIARSPDSLYRINIVKAARETTGSEAEKIAEKITFILQQKDSIIYLPKGFAIAATDKFRNQQVILVVEVPVGKNIRIDGANEWFDFFDIKGRRNGLHLNFSYNYDDQFYPFKYDRWYKMRSDGLSKLGQSPEERIEELKDQLEDEFREFRRDDRTSRDSIKVKIDGKDTLIDIKVGLSQRMGV